MKILVTGAAGFIGSHFVEAAERSGHETMAIDCLTYAGRSANLSARQPPGWAARNLYRGDICDSGFMEACFGKFQPDAIVHLAAESHVGRSIDSRDEFLRTNVLGTGVLLEVALAYWKGLNPKRESGISPMTNAAVRHARFRFVHVSTDEVYGSLRPNEEPWTEASPYAPNNPYSASKAASDFLVRSYFRTFGLPAIITHSSNNYGPRQHPEKLIPILIKQAVAGERMTLHGDGQNIRDWIHVEDHCAGLLAAVEHGSAGETYNFGASCERTNQQIAFLILDHVPHTKFGIAYVEDRPGNDFRYSTNWLKAFAELAWFPGAQIEQRLGETVKWYLDNPNYELDYGR